jgi:ubiquinone/menaquinone biosynthesis C-methylase UbiE
MGPRSRRKQLVGQASGSVLEIGIGTGKNLPFYNSGVDVTGIDVSSGMLSRAKRRLASLSVAAVLIEADVHDLPFDDNSFDTVVGTSVFCSVADPVMGMAELGRVVKTQGRILLLEHVRPRNRLLGLLADLATVLTRRIFGFRANRRTEENVAASGLDVVDVKRNGIWRTIVARTASSSTEGRTG